MLITLDDEVVERITRTCSLMSFDFLNRIWCLQWKCGRRRALSLVRVPVQICQLMSLSHLVIARWYTLESQRWRNKSSSWATLFKYVKRFTKFLTFTKKASVWVIERTCHSKMTKVGAEKTSSESSRREYNKLSIRFLSSVPTG